MKNNQNIFGVPLDFLSIVPYNYIVGQKKGYDMTRDDMIMMLMKNFEAMNSQFNKDGSYTRKFEQAYFAERRKLDSYSDLKLQNMVLINC